MHRALHRSYCYFAYVYVYVAEGLEYPEILAICSVLLMTDMSLCGETSLFSAQHR